MSAATPRQSTAAPIGAIAAAGQPAWSAHAAPRAAKADEPSEVHVHIGRIDVSAVHEPATPRRRAAVAAAPMSLDTYFTKRGRA